MGASILPLVACIVDGESTDDMGDDASDDMQSETSDGNGTCSTIPEETAGPYPGDGSNGPNILTESGVVRSDIRSSIGAASGTADGIVTTVTLTLVDLSDGCTPLSGYAIYLWHCDREGRYSMYSEGVTDQNYLRGVQESDDAGQVTFTTIFPACYSGRWPHMHFEVYPSLAAAAAAEDRLATSQLAMPEADCAEVYATEGYEDSVGNLASVSLDTDNVFSDGVSSQLATVSGSVAEGYAASLTVGIVG